VISFYYLPPHQQQSARRAEWIAIEAALLDYGSPSRGIQELVGISAFNL